MERDEAREYLRAGDSTHIDTSDSRVFVVVKCTEYRPKHDTEHPRMSIAAQQSELLLNKLLQRRWKARRAACNAPLDLNTDMSRRFIGLVVIPGQHITKIKLDKPTTGAHGG
ncbi:hypothetical protein TESG_08564 [Trichophyton tonsurans CBS 112818]|uniref:Uncharacterized protein n=1 Tax=Trichophyton tonsurans (strain CBS 112818) TaxID=647933 RepID=F2S516_TRIT1|nr:hypothetical protein TESG_08564 [Trichophyton tonsurans CBS 112818]